MVAKVEIYTSPSCPYCVRAKTLLDKKSVSYTEVRVDQNPQTFEEMVRRSNGKRTVPQIFINGVNVGGFDDLWNLEKQGKLDRLLI